MVLTSTTTLSILARNVYIVAYTVVMVFAMVRNGLSIPYSWPVRPRLFVYAWFVVEIYLFPATMDYVLWFFNGLLAFNTVAGFVKICGRI